VIGHLQLAPRHQDQRCRSIDLQRLGSRCVLACLGARGREIRTDIFGPEWQVWSWVERDLEELRATLNVSSAESPPR
jgi:hypothetical protein